MSRTKTGRDETAKRAAAAPKSGGAPKRAAAAPKSGGAPKRATVAPKRAGTAEATQVKRPKADVAARTAKAKPDAKKAPKVAPVDVAVDVTEAAAAAVPSGPGTSPVIVAQMRELERQLDRLIEEASRPDLAALDREDAEAEAKADAEAEAKAKADAEVEAKAREAAKAEEEEPPVPSGPVSARPPASIPFPRPSGPLPQVASGTSETTVFDTARELLSTDFYLRKWGRLAMRNRSEEVDDFGYDPIYDEKVRPALDFLYARYFRVAATGVDRVPATGRCLLVANHSGTVPLDGVMIKTALRREHPSARHVRWLTEDFIYHFPYLGGAMNRLGAVRACQENAERLLAQDELVAVFPEGIKGIGKLFAQRYRLQRFGRGGFIKLALRTQTPIVPVAVVGAEETNPLLFRIEHLAKLVGLPYVPVTPTFPLLGPAGLLPAPTKWRMTFGEPLDLSTYGPESADDDLLVGRLAERVRATIQGMLDHELGARKSVFFG